MPDPILQDTLNPTAVPPAASPGVSDLIADPYGKSGSLRAGLAGLGMVALRPVCPFLPSGLAAQPAPSPLPSPLVFGIEAIDARLPAGGLQAHGLHELKPQTARDAGSAVVLALALAARQSQRPLLMVLAGRAGAEHGLPYGPGLTALGLDPKRLLVVTATRAADALWAIEEALRTQALGAVIASIESVGIVPARRLVLAASQGGTPCLMVTGPAKTGISVAHSRWRVGSLASAPHPLDASAPGAWRCALALERCRQGPSDLAWRLEWCDASYSFHLAAGLSPATAATAGARRRTG